MSELRFDVKVMGIIIGTCVHEEFAEWYEEPVIQYTDFEPFPEVTSAPKTKYLSIDLVEGTYKEWQSGGENDGEVKSTGKILKVLEN